MRKTTDFIGDVIDRILPKRRDRPTLVTRRQCTASGVFAMAETTNSSADIRALVITAETLRKKAAMLERANRLDIAEIYNKKANQIEDMIQKTRDARERAA